jgi:hypothetical protein
MDRAYTRHVGLGLAGALVTGTRDVAALSLWAAKAGSRTALAAPLRRPARRIIGAAEHRGALNEARLLSDARHISAEWFARAARGPVLDDVVRALVEAGALRTAAERDAGARTDRSRDGTATVDDWIGGLARERLHGQAHAALLAGFEDGAAPA